MNIAWENIISKMKNESICFSSLIRRVTFLYVYTLYYYMLYFILAVFTV